MQKLLDIMAQLRDPLTGCPWDLEQDFASIAPYTIEEAYEVADAIERGEWQELCDELGDLLFQVVFHAQMAREAGLFSYEDVVAAICDKMVRRHPHVFADDERGNASRQLARWEDIKAAERKAAGKTAAPSALDGIATALPGLQRAAKVGSRAARVGFDWPDAAGVRTKLDEEVAELDAALAVTNDPSLAAKDANARAAVEDELGDLLFTAAQLGRHLDIDPARALRRATAKFERRFRHMEAAIAATGASLVDLTPAQYEQAWEAAKTASDSAARS